MLFFFTKTKVFIENNFFVCIANSRQYTSTKKNIPQMRDALYLNLINFYSVEESTCFTLLPRFVVTFTK